MDGRAKQSAAERCAETSDAERAAESRAKKKTKEREKAKQGATIAPNNSQRVDIVEQSMYLGQKVFAQSKLVAGTPVGQQRTGIDEERV